MKKGSRTMNSDDCIKYLMSESGKYWLRTFRANCLDYLQAHPDVLLEIIKKTSEDVFHPNRKL